VEENCYDKVKLARVKWVDVCRSKEDGGLGIRNLRLVNILLLTKWRWRLISSQDILWWLVLKAKYGMGIGFSPDLSKCRNVKFTSIWWRDLCSLGCIRANDDGDWCTEVMKKKLGEGGGTRFWLDIWVGPKPLCEVFTRLFPCRYNRKIL
jgi:hypothetical protein